MKEKFNLSFERNHYFYGKLLSVGDFQLEQQYHNDKRRLLSALLFSEGFLAGFHTSQSGDNAVRVEAGAALDCFGREVVLGKPVTKKLHLLPGYEGNSRKGYTHLCVEYEETLEERAHSLEETHRQEFNKVKESCRFYLTETERYPWDQPGEENGSVTKIIWENPEFAVALTAPRYVSPQERFAVTLRLAALTEQQEPVQITATLKSLLFLDDDRKGEIAVFGESAQEGERSWQFWLNVDSWEEEMGSLELAAESLAVSLGGQKLENELAVTEELRWLIAVVDDPQGRIQEHYYKQNLEDLLATRSDKRKNQLYLARIHYITYENSCVISEVEPFPFKQYHLPKTVRPAVRQPAEQVRSREDGADLQQEFKKEVLERYRDLSQERTYCTSGQTVLKLGARGKKNMIHRSVEIAHGLGEGPVYLTVGMLKEEILEDTILYGDPGLFTEDEISEGFPQVETAILLKSSKGVFQIAVKLLESTDLRELKLVWHAFSAMRTPVGTEADALEIQPSVVKVDCLEEVRLILTGPSEELVRDVDWSVVGSGSGKISKGGIYTAPSLPGVYEIQARLGEKVARAFAVVEALREDRGERP